MGIKKHSLLENGTVKETTLAISYGKEGMWLEAGDTKYYIDKAGMYGILSDMVGYLASFEEDLPELMEWLEMITSDIKES